MYYTFIAFLRLTLYSVITAVQSNRIKAGIPGCDRHTQLIMSEHRYLFLTAVCSRWYLLCRINSLVTKELASLQDEESARTLGGCAGFVGI